jgi:dTDP-glucose 4,6-dehydratase
MNKFLILGSNSVSAGYLIKLLLTNKNNKLIGFSRNKQYLQTLTPFNKNNKSSLNFQFHKIDIKKDYLKAFKIIDKFAPNYVINYAAQGEVRNSWNYPLDWYETNIISTIRIIEFLKNKKYIKKYISVSTPEVYGSSLKKITENGFFNPSTPYAISKLSSDLHLKAIYRQYKFPVVFTRSANIYGPHQQFYRIIPKTIINLNLGKKIILHGKGLTQRSFIHASDAANFTLNVIKKGKSGEVYHCSTNEKPISIKELVKIICIKMNKNFNESVTLNKDNFGQDQCYFLNSIKAKQKLNWYPKFKLSEGIDSTIEWIKKDWSTIKKQELNYIHQK